MNASQRRAHILDYLRAAQAPLSATALAQRLSVSRQIIVGDVALLRASGEGVIATPRGYVLDRPRPGLTRTVACLHSGADMERELTLMVDRDAWWKTSSWSTRCTASSPGRWISPPGMISQNLYEKLKKTPPGPCPCSPTESTCTPCAVPMRRPLSGR